MKGKKSFEGEIFRARGPEPEYGENLKIVVNSGAVSFKEELLIVGENGFRAFPSEELYLELESLLDKKITPVGVITEIKKEGKYGALFRID